MRSFRTLLWTLAVVVLSACGGGSGSAVPATSDAETRAPSGSTIAYENRTLWVGYRQSQLNEWSTNASGSVNPARRFTGAWPWPNNQPNGYPVLSDVALAPDGTTWVLLRQATPDGRALPGWRLLAYSPGETNAANDENIYGDDVQTAVALGLGGEGVEVGLAGPNGIATIATYAMASSNSPPFRTFQTSGSVIGFAAANPARIYLARPTGFEIYRQSSTGCCPLTTIVTDTPQNMEISQEFAVGPDKSIYAADWPRGGVPDGTGKRVGVVYVNVYPNGSGHAARRIGPLPAYFGGLARPPVINVDANNRLYVATSGKIYRFGPKANGSATPDRVITDPTTDYPAALAIGP